MELFAERAAAAVPGFALDAGVCGTVAEVCRRLDRLPLALELAATRLRTLDIQELARRLDDRFQLLSNGPTAAHWRPLRRSAREAASMSGRCWRRSPAWWTPRSS
jgi:predicted ATPase